jgi:hypothetical protein
MTKILVNHSNWDAAVNLILGDLGRAIGASRVYMFKNIVREGRICALKQHAYHNNAFRKCSVGDLTECVNYDLMPEWQSRMEHGLSASGSVLECDLCLHKKGCVCKEDTLVCAVPIFVDKEWWGFIGFDYTNGTRIWKDEDETLLRISADIFGGIIYHRDRYWDKVGEMVDCEDKLEKESN